eukprot:8379092-Ditylum_brightwellii.AAC.1
MRCQVPFGTEVDTSQCRHFKVVVHPCDGPCTGEPLSIYTWPSWDFLQDTNQELLCTDVCI